MEFKLQQTAPLADRLRPQTLEEIVGQIPIMVQNRCFSMVMMPVVAVAESRLKTSFSKVHPCKWHFLFFLSPN